jgi:Sulfotransferase family
MEGKRIAVLGLYRSGSTVVAGVLQHLGVDMGAPFYDRYYESDWLSKQLRQWWDEPHSPHLREKVAQPKRVRMLAEWIQKREQAGAKWVGMKHPLLSLCGEDLMKAWGEKTKFIRCCRPLDESVESMKRGMGFRGDARLVQGTLLAALDRFFAGRQCLEVSFADMMNNPGREIQRIIEFLQISPNNDARAAALHFVQPGQQAKVEIELQEQKARSAKRRPLGKLWKALCKAVPFVGK